MVDCTGLENRQRATVREFESHRLRQNYFDKLLIFKVNTNILPITNQQANIKTTIKSRDAGCMTAFVFLSCHSPLFHANRYRRSCAERQSHTALAPHSCPVLR